jgi:16S rRNA (cytosine967-C5)-methyltransferase
MSKAGATVRAVAAEIVDAVVGDGRSLDVALASAEHRVAESECALLRMLCYGTLRNYWRLQSIVTQLLSKPLKKHDRVVNALLAVGLLQLIHLRIPDHAVVSQTVEASRILKRPKLAGLLNACLRRCVREDLGAQPPPDEASRWNHPQWFIDALQEDWRDDWQAILLANNERAPMWLRVNASRACASDYRQRLANAGIESEIQAGMPDALRLLAPAAVDDLPGFRDGDASVQDGAAQVAARWLLQGRSGRILDACAAPGGKSGHLLEIGGDAISLVAVDNDIARVQIIRENLSRIGRDATIIAGDASKPEEWWDGRLFDNILLDAPCSASGVIRRHPDIKLLRRKSDLKRLSALQADLLRALWPLLAPGGRFLYVTCSVFAQENDAVVEQFLSDQADAVENDVLPNNNIHDLMRRKACGYQILPGTAALDGFYFACLAKQAGSRHQGPVKVS